MSKMHRTLTALRFRLEQAWNYFCDSDTRLYAKRHEPDDPIIFLRLYALLIFFFAFLYSIWGQWCVPNGKESLSALDSLYLSVVTITTLGYGDITPASSGQKLLVATEAFTGIIILGWFLVQLGQNISTREFKEFHANERKRQDKSSFTLYTDLAKAFNGFFNYFDAEHPQDKSRLNFVNYHFGSQVVHKGSAYFKTDSFIKTKTDMNRLEGLAESKYWCEGISECSNKVESAIDNSLMNTYDDEIFVEKLENYRKCSKAVLEKHSNLRDDSSLEERCKILKPLAENIYALREHIFTKADEHQTYSDMKYVGDMVRSDYERRKLVERAEKFQNAGLKVGAIARIILRKTKLN